MKKAGLILLALLPALASGEEVQGAGAPQSSRWQCRTLIDIPTAGALEKGDYDFEVRMYADGGLLCGFTVGLFRRFNMGLSYGGTNVIGDSKEIKGNDEPGVEVRYRLFEETGKFPALAVGYASQGYGRYMRNTEAQYDRYRYKAKGLFAAASKNFLLAGRGFGVHGGVNFNTKETDDDKGLNYFVGADFWLNEELCLLAEYDFALNDDTAKSFGRGEGYFHAALRWAFADHLVFQINFKDLLKNNRDSKTIEREVKIIYSQSINF